MSESEVVRQESEFAALVGIDWADQKHAWCVQAAGTTQREAERWNIHRKRSRRGSGNSVNDSAIGRLRWRWNK